MSRETGYKREIAWNLQALGQNLSDAGQREGVAPLLRESIAVGRESGDVTSSFCDSTLRSTYCRAVGPTLNRC